MKVTGLVLVNGDCLTGTGDCRTVAMEPRRCHGAPPKCKKDVQSCFSCEAWWLSGKAWTAKDLAVKVKVFLLRKINLGNANGIRLPIPILQVFRSVLDSC